ncbi:MAG: LCP family protein [Pleurocapsa sp.]
MPLNKAYQPTPSGKKSAAEIKARRQKKSQSKKSNRSRAILVGLGLAAVSLVSAAAGAILAITFSTASPLQQAELTPEEKQVFSQEETVTAKALNVPELSRPVNILILGIKVLTSDLKNESLSTQIENAGYLELVNSFEGLSDTMLLVRFDPQKEQLSVLSIPRDTRIYLDGYGIGKINRANEYGGPALAAAATSELLGGVNVDRYVRVNVQGIEKLIDALGGVTVDVPKDMKYNDFSQHLYINLKKGRQHLDGDKALQFLRYRYDGLGDISRIQRQQMLMRSTVEQTLQPNTILKIPKILDVIQSHIDTNLTVKELMALAAFASQTERSEVKMMMLPGDFNDPSEKVSYWLPDGDRIETLMAQHFDLPRIEENYEIASNSSYISLEEEADNRTAKLRISLQDSTEDPQALQAALDLLRQAGYQRISVVENSQDPLPETKIIAQSGDEKAAKELRGVLGVGEVLVESTGAIYSDVTIQIGSDWQQELLDNLGTEDTEQNLNDF